MTAPVQGATVVVCAPDDLRAMIDAAVRAALAEHAPAATPEILDTEAACVYLGVARATLHRLVRSGQVRQRRIGDSPRYLRAELLDAVRGGGS